MSFMQGQTVFDRSGHKYQFVEALSGDRALCRPILLADLYDGGTEEYPADTPSIFQTSALSAKPPIAVVSAELQELQARIAAARAQLSEANADLRGLERERDERMQRLQNHPKLQRLEDFLAGRISHFVLTSPYGTTVEIKTLEEVLAQDDPADRKEKFKLLSLFGRSGGDIQWAVNRWSDGSGTWREGQPFTSYEDALQFASDRIDAEWEAWRASPENYRWLANPITAATALGLPIPEDVQAARRKQLVAAAQSKINKANADLALAQSELENATVPG